MSFVWLRTVCERLPRRRRNATHFVSHEQIECRTLLTASIFSTSAGTGLRRAPSIVEDQQPLTPVLSTKSHANTHSSPTKSGTTDVPQNTTNPTAIPTFDFSGKWNYTGESINGYIIVNQLNKKADTLLRIGDLEFDMNAKIHGDRLTGKFKKTIPMLKINGKFDVTRVNSTTFLGTLTVKTNGNSNDFSIQGIHV